MLQGFAAYVRRHHLAMIALFVALGGVSYAAINLPRNSVGPSEIKTNAVRAAEIRKNAVASREARNDALRGVDIREATLNCVQIPDADCSADDATEGGGTPETGSQTESFSFRTSNDQTVNNLVNAGGLTIDVSCTAGNLTATAETSVDNSWITTASVSSTNSVDPIFNQDNDSDFDSPDPRPLLGENQDFQGGHTVYAAGNTGPVVNVHWGSDENTPNLGCLFVGHVTVD